MWALIVDGAVHELFEAEPHLNPALQVVTAPADTQVGYLYTNGVISPPSAPTPTLADRQAALAAERYAHECAGVEFQAAGASAPSLVGSDLTSQAKLSAAYQAAHDGHWVDATPWKMVDGSFVPLTAADMQAMALKVLAYVSACYAREAQLASQLTVNISTDITQGWPANT